jgi:Sulfotransferase domain
MGAGSIINLARKAGAQLLRLVPGSAALALKRDLRDAAWLAEADAVIVSYPKSGRTFVRAMLARLFQRQFGIDERRLLEFPMLEHAAAGIPRLLFTHAGDTMRAPNEIHLDAQVYRGKRVVLIARHPGDIAVSRYHHLKHRSRDRARRQLAELPLEQFVWADQGGIPSIVKFLNDFAGLRGVVIVRYEDFLMEPAKALTALAKAIGLKFGAEDIADAVEFGSLDQLRRYEREGYFESSRLRAARKGDEQSFKVRQGKSGGYRGQLAKAEVKRVDDYVAAHLDPHLGYSSKRRARK